MVQRSLLSFTLGLFVLSGCDCGVEPLDARTPEVAIGDPLSEDSSFCTTDRNRDCTMSFGGVGTGQGMFATFLIESIASVDLTVESMAFSADSDPAFTISSGPAPGDKVDARSDTYRGAEVVVRFAPSVEGTTRATLLIQTDANNVEGQEGLVTIELVGDGLDLGRPQMVISPPACNFGDVGVGVTAFCDITIENQGTRDLELQGVGFTAETDLNVFGAQTVIPIPSYVAPGTGLSVRLYAQPEEPGVVEGGLTLTSNDREQPEALVPLSVNGAQAPTAIPEILSVNGVAYAGAAIGPLDDVILTGAA